jgi:hypothetical protein
MSGLGQPSGLRNARLKPTPNRTRTATTRADNLNRTLCPIR